MLMAELATLKTFIGDTKMWWRQMLFHFSMSFIMVLFMGFIVVGLGLAIVIALVDVNVWLKVAGLLGLCVIIGGLAGWVNDCFLVKFEDWLRKTYKLR